MLKQFMSDRGVTMLPGYDSGKVHGRIHDFVESHKKKTQGGQSHEGAKHTANDGSRAVPVRETG